MDPTNATAPQEPSTPRRELVEVRGNSGPKPRPVRELSALARDQEGVAGHDQILALGFTHEWIKHRIATGWLHVVFRGAYAVGHRRLTWRGRLRAAILSCGPGTYISHRSAAALHGLRRGGGGLIHVTAPPGGREDRRQGIVLHRIRNMGEQERSEVDCIPVTSPARTCLDLAAIVPNHVLDAMIEQAERAGTFDLAAFDAVCRRGRPGSAALRRALALYRPLPDWTRSELERRALRELHRAGIRPDGVNVWMEDAAAEVDMVFHDQKLVIEIDGDAVHGTTAARQRDPQRDARLQAADYLVLRVPERRLVHTPRAYVEDVKALLSRAGRTRALPGRPATALPA